MKESTTKSFLEKVRRDPKSWEMTVLNMPGGNQELSAKLTEQEVSRRNRSVYSLF